MASLPSRIDAAKAEWHAMSNPSDRPLLGYKDRPLDGAFREIDGVAAWLAWEDGAGRILRFERITTTQSGAAKALLRKLIAISEKYEVPLEGNAIPVPTAECPVPDSSRLVALYRSVGFEVSEATARLIRYPPQRKNTPMYPSDNGTST